MPRISTRAQVAPFLAMDVLREANLLESGGERVYHLETGQPGARPAKAVLAAVRRALLDDPLGYTEALGRPAMRAAISEHYRQTYGLDIDPARVIVTTGSSTGFILGFLAAFDAGQKVVMGSPGYPAYRNTASALNLEPVLVPVDRASNFQFPLDRLERVDDAQGLLIASPGNPTGTILPANHLQELAAVCQRKGWHLVSDEIYHGISYGLRTACVLEFAPDAIVINSFSKFYAMTGWRIGWMIVPEYMVRTIERLAQNLFISPPAISQVAGLAALSTEAKHELSGHIGQYRRNRDLLLAALSAAGANDVAPADGAFYVYVCVENFCTDSKDLASAMLRETGIAATPGWDFDPEHGGQWLRFSTAGQSDEVSAVSRLLTLWLARRRRR